MAKLMKRVSAMLCAVVLIVTMLPVPARAAAKNPIPNGWYMIVSGNSDDRVLDIHDNSQANGGNLEIYTKNNTTNQRFYLKYLNNGYYSIRVLHSGKYLHRSGDGSNVHQWDGDGNNNAQWALEDAGNGYYYLRNRNGNYMDNSGGRTTLANNVCMWTSNGSAAQKWKFLSTADTKNEKKSLSNGWYMIESGNNRDRVLNINNWNMGNGGNLETSKKNGTTNQVFYLEYRNNGYYAIRVCHSGKYLHKSGSKENVHQWDGNGNNNAQWSLEPAGSGYYYLRNKNGNYLDNNGGRTTLGNNVGTYVLNRTPAQKWKFISTSEPASQLKISGQAVPGTIKQGSGFTVKGTISSNYIITKVTVGIYDAKGNAVSTKTVTPNSRSFNVNSIDKDIHFGQAKAGTNYYKVWATDKKSTNKLLQNTNFTVTSDVPTASSWQWPMKTSTKGYRVSQGFGSTAVGRTGRPYHAGIDITANGNPPIYAAAAGKVKYRGGAASASKDGNGYHVILQHTLNGKTVYTLYSHLKSYADCPAVGKTVKKGQKIGTMGNTGNSTGPHLHFAVFTGKCLNSPWGYTATFKKGSSKSTYDGTTFYDPTKVVANGKLP